MESYDVIIIGAGASGLMCAAESARRGRRTLMLDHSSRPGQKILVSGGGKCNFTNRSITPENYISGNPQFCRSALSRYTNEDFIALVDRYLIPWEERDHGQLFTTSSSADIRNMLINEVLSAGAELKSGVEITKIRSTADSGDIVGSENQRESRYEVGCGNKNYSSESLVVAAGGLSWPATGASPLGYKIAGQFGIPVTPLSSGLVPLTLQKAEKDRFTALTGIAVPASVYAGGRVFTDNLLFTHRGISGPAVLQASSYWNPGEEIRIDFLPGGSTAQILEKGRLESPRSRADTLLNACLPKRLVLTLIPEDLAGKPVNTLKTAEIASLAEAVHRTKLVPAGTEGARTAEVTRGGISVDALSSKTFETKNRPGLYFIGEVLDVTGWLGGYNLQWAWSSGWCAGQYV
jgi:predicted Rossmann fold flavoprotein